MHRHAPASSRPHARASRCSVVRASPILLPTDGRYILHRDRWLDLTKRGGGRRADNDGGRVTRQQGRNTWRSRRSSKSSTTAKRCFHTVCLPHFLESPVKISIGDATKASACPHRRVILQMQFLILGRPRFILRLHYLYLIGLQYYRCSRTQIGEP